MAVSILTFYNFPILQVILSLQLNLIYLCILLAFKVNKNPRARIQQIINECSIIITIYILSGFLGEVIQTAEGRELHGYFLIAFTLLNFLLNLIPVAFDVIEYIKRFCKRM